MVGATRHRLLHFQWAGRGLKAVFSVINNACLCAFVHCLPLCPPQGITWIMEDTRTRMARSRDRLNLVMTGRFFFFLLFAIFPPFKKKLDASLTSLRIELVECFKEWSGLLVVGGQRGPWIVICQSSIMAPDPSHLKAWSSILNNDDETNIMILSKVSHSVMRQSAGGHAGHTNTWPW